MTGDGSWLDGLPQLTRLQHLSLLDGGTHGWLQLAALTSLTHLELHSGHTDQELVALLAALHSGGLRALGVSATHMTRNNLTAHTQHLTGLTNLMVATT